MTKSRLSKQQQVTINKRQQAMLEKADQAFIGTIVARFGQEALLKPEGSTYAVSAKLKRNLRDIVVGDVVYYEKKQQEYAVQAILPRKTTLYKENRWGKRKLVAANIDQVIIVMAIFPAYQRFLLDCYLAAAELAGIKPVVLFNKVDLLDDKNSLTADAELYRALGYAVYNTSVATGEGMDELRKTLDSKQSVFVGQSGVGKSSLIQSLLPEETIDIGEISEKQALGKHTTAVSHLYDLHGQNASIIDSPGVREFALSSDTSVDQLFEGFIELKAYVGQCEFRNCNHMNDRGCALIAAAKHGEISPSRLTSFQQLLEKNK